MLDDLLFLFGLVVRCVGDDDDDCVKPNTETENGGVVTE